MLKSTILRALRQWRSRPYYSESHSLTGMLDAWATADDHPTKAETEAAAKFTADSINSLADAIVTALKADDGEMLKDHDDAR